MSHTKQRITWTFIIPIPQIYLIKNSKQVSPIFNLIKKIIQQQISYISLFIPKITIVSFTRQRALTRWRTETNIVRHHLDDLILYLLANRKFCLKGISFLSEGKSNFLRRKILFLSDINLRSPQLLLRYPLSRIKTIWGNPKTAMRLCRKNIAYRLYSHGKIRTFSNKI